MPCTAPPRREKAFARHHTGPGRKKVGQFSGTGLDLLMTTRITFRFDFGGERKLGPGKIALLEAIRAHGSIAAAGRDFGDRRLLR